MVNLAIDEKVKLFELLQNALDHHDTSKPDVSFDLGGLAKSLAPMLAQALVAKVLSDPEIVAKLFGGLFGGQRPTVEPPAAPAPSAPTKPAASVTPDAIELELRSVSGPRRNGAPTIPYRLADGGLIVLTEGHDALDDGSILNFDAGISANGVGLRVDLDPAKTPAGQKNHPELLGKIRFVARDAESGDVLAAIGGPGASIRSADDYTADNVEDGAAFVPHRWAETGGMSVALVIKRKGGPVVVSAEIGAEETQGFTTPGTR